MNIEDGFIPDFKLSTTTGIISTKGSKLLQKEHISYISIYNRIQKWNAKTQEFMSSLGTGKHPVSSFIIIGSLLIIGYDNGLIETIDDKNDSRKIRIHKRRVTDIIESEYGFISSSADGSICLFDILLGEPKIFYEGNSVAAEKIIIENGRLIALCVDKSLKIWSIENKDLEDAIVFDDYLFNFIAQGNEILAIQRNGESFIVDLITKERKSFECFKKIRNMIRRNNKLIIHMQKKIAIFNITKEQSLGLFAVDRKNISDTLIQVDCYFNDLIFLTKNNSIEVLGQKNTQIAHSSEILNIKTIENTIFSLSTEKMIIWSKDTDNKYSGLADDSEISEFGRDTLEIISWFAVKKATCFCIFNDFIVVGNNFGLSVYNKNNYELIKEIITDSVTCLCAYADILAVASASSVTFFDDNFDQVNNLNLCDISIFAKFSPDGRNFCVSTLDNKIHIFNFPELDLRISLYGHSLPVRSFAISPDSKYILSCGADKLVKLWGLEYGECKRTYIGNANSIAFISDKLFIFTEKNEVQYYEGNKKLRSFKSFLPGVISLSGDFFIISSERGLSLFKMNKYEYMGDDLSDDEDEVLARDIANPDAYDKFLEYIEKLEVDFSQTTIELFYEFLEKTELSELLQLLYVLDCSSIHILISVVGKMADRNIILNARLFTQLFKFHGHLCISHSEFFEIRDVLLKKVAGLRYLVGSNEMQLAVDMNYVDINCDDINTENNL